MTEATLEEEVDAIYELIEDGDADGADEKLRNALETFGQQPDLLVLQAEIALEEEDFVGAATAAQQSLGTTDDPEVVARLKSIEAYAEYYRDNLEKARAAFNAAVRADPELITSLIGRAMVHEQLGFFNAAMLDLDRVIETDDQLGQPFAMRGSIRLRTGNLQEAEGDLEHAVAMDPDDEESRLNLARLHALQQHTSRALELLEPLVEEGEETAFVAPGALLRSQLSLAMGSIDAALEDAEQAIELLPDEPWGYLQAAACHISRGIDGGAAIELCKQAEKCVRSVRDLPDLYPLRASAYDILGKADKAATQREEAEGVARLPDFVYGVLNPAGNIPINPNKPIDIRGLLDELFGEAANAPEGYEEVLRQIVEQIPELAQEHPGVETINIELPEAPGMVGGQRQLVVSLGQARNNG